MKTDSQLSIDLTNKIVLITGSSRGIGSCLAQAFATNNAEVIVTYCNNKEPALDYIIKRTKGRYYVLTKEANWRTRGRYYVLTREANCAIINPR